MFTEILKITPKVDSGDLNKMENSLNTRFKSVAKKFGAGLVSVLKGGAVIGTVLAIVEKIVNPFKEVREAIERALDRGDDLVTFAKQFGTTAGNLARLQALAEAKGLTAEGLRTLLLKFQGAVTDAAANPGEVTAVSQFVGRKDMAEAFFEFIQSMQNDLKYSDAQRNFIQREVFGEKQIGKASSFLNANFPELIKKIGGPTGNDLTGAALALDSRKSALKEEEAKRNLRDLFDKGVFAATQPGVFKTIDRIDRNKLAAENRNLGKAGALAKADQNIDELQAKALQWWIDLAPAISKILPHIVDISTFLTTDLRDMKYDWAKKMVRDKMIPQKEK